MSDLEVVRLVLGVIAALTFVKAGLDQPQGTMCYGIALLAVMLALPARTGRKSAGGAPPLPDQPPLLPGTSGAVDRSPQTAPTPELKAPTAAAVKYVTCSACQSENWIGYRECQGCGTPLS